MSANEWKTDDDFQSAFNEAVECFSPPAGLKEQIEKRLADGRDCETPATPSSPKSIRRQATADRQNQISYLLERIRHMKRWKKTLITAAAAAVVIAAVGVWMHMPNGSVPSFTGITFADVQRQMENIKTLSCIISTSGPVTVGTGDETIEIIDYNEKGEVIKREKKVIPAKKETKVVNQDSKEKIIMKEPGLLRVEILEDSLHPETAGTYTISDSRTGKAVCFIPKMKLYAVQENCNASSNGVVSSLFLVRQEMNKLINSGEAKPLGEKLIDGRKAKGYEAGEGNARGEVWADAETGMPILIIGASGSSQKDMRGKGIISNIRINESLDDSLFSMEIPKGYKDVNDPATGFNTENKDKPGVKTSKSYTTIFPCDKP
jgi:outer membrane lipoprotein-sorting protein